MASKKGSNKTLWIVVAVVACGAAGTTFACCGGLFGVGMFGMGMIEDDLERQLGVNPTLVAEIGTLQSFDYALMESGGYPGFDVLAYRATGTTGGGIVVVSSSTVGDSEVIAWAVLFPDHGGRVELVGYVPPGIGPPQ